MVQFDFTLVTYEGLPDLCFDDRLLRTALEDRGARVRSAVWSDPTVDWAASDLTVCRSMWDYFHRVEAFVSWLGRVDGSTRLINSTEVLRWNLDKRYLLELGARGVTIVPTRVVTRGEPFDLLETAHDLGSSDLVIKPTISGSAFGAKRVSLATEMDAAVTHVTKLLFAGDVMIQPFLCAVLQERERSLVFFGSTFSHGYLKAPFSAGAAAGLSDETAYDPSSDEVLFAREVLNAAQLRTEYARVDFVPDQGRLLLMELELIEPNLQFHLSHGSAEAFAGRLCALTANSMR